MRRRPVDLGDLAVGCALPRIPWWRPRLRRAQRELLGEILRSIVRGDADDAIQRAAAERVVEAAKRRYRDGPVRGADVLIDQPVEPVEGEVTMPTELAPVYRPLSTWSGGG